MNMALTKSNALKFAAFSVVAFLTINPDSAFALPVVEVPGGGSEDYVKTAKDIFIAIISLIILVISGTAFVVVAKNSIAAFNEWRAQKIELFQFLMIVAGAIGLLIFVIFLLTAISDSLGISF